LKSAHILEECWHEHDCGEEQDSDGNQVAIMTPGQKVEPSCPGNVCSTATSFCCGATAYVAIAASDDVAMAFADAAAVDDAAY